MGEIYLAYTEGPGGFRKDVVIKRIMPHLAQEEEFVTRFIDEANIVVLLTHGNIVPVFDMGHAEGEYFIAMEYIAGRDLRDIVKRSALEGKTVPANIAVYLISETCKGLAYAHKKCDSDGTSLGIIHRDVSPSNILVSREGVVKLTDFGIAKAVSRIGRSITGRLQGKFCYMSPEQASGKSVDLQTDIFSLGSVAYEVLTGTRPFEGESDLATLELVKTAEVKPPSSVLEGLPESIDEVLLKALAKAPEDRYQDANEFGKALRATIGDEIATESEMAEFLADLFKGQVAAFGASSGLNLDDLLALEADRFLLSGGGTNTITAPTPSFPARTQTGPVGPATTPQPELQHTPGPVIRTEPRRRYLRVLVVLVLLAAIPALNVILSPSEQIQELTIECSEPDAQVFVDNHLEGICPLTMELEIGEYLIVSQLTGFASATASVTIGEERPAAVFLELSPSSPTTVAVTVTAEPASAEYSLDGLMWARSGVPVQTEPGPHSVMVRAEGYQSAVFQRTFDTENLTANLQLELIPEPTPDAVDEQIDTDDGSHRNGTDNAQARTDEVRIRVIPTPSDALVTVDGHDRGTGSRRLTFRKDTGVRIVVVSRDGYASSTERIDTSSAESGNLRIELVETAQLRPVRFQLTYPAVGELFIDGRSHGSENMTVELAPGTYQIRLRNQETGLEESRLITVVAGPGNQVERFFAP